MLTENWIAASELEVKGNIYTLDNYVWLVYQQSYDTLSEIELEGLN